MYLISTELHFLPLYIGYTVMFSAIFLFQVYSSFKFNEDMNKKIRENDDLLNK